MKIINHATQRRTSLTEFCRLSSPHFDRYPLPLKLQCKQKFWPPPTTSWDTSQFPGGWRIIHRCSMAHACTVASLWGCRSHQGDTSQRGDTRPGLAIGQHFAFPQRCQIGWATDHMTGGTWIVKWLLAGCWFGWSCVLMWRATMIKAILTCINHDKPQRCTF